MFSSAHPDITVELIPGNHEELYQLLRRGLVNLVLNDQRRVFSEEYINVILASVGCWVEISAISPMAGLPSVTPQEMKNTPCILVSSPSQQDTERTYYHDIVGFHGEFLFAENLDDARLLVIGGRGFLPAEGGSSEVDCSCAIRRIPLHRDNAQMTRNYCAFWRKDNAGLFAKEFCEILRQQFVSEQLINESRKSN